MADRIAFIYLLCRMDRVVCLCSLSCLLRVSETVWALTRLSKLRPQSVKWRDYVMLKISLEMNAKQQATGAYIYSIGLASFFLF